MLQIVKLSVTLLGVAGFVLCGVEPAAAACQLVKATHSADSKAAAAKTSQALAVQSAKEVKRARGWRSYTMSARKVQGDPFWKSVRPDGVPKEAMLKPDIVTARFYTTCFTGVWVPYVCTTGSAVCGN
jgi:hypothetical protein